MKYRPLQYAAALYGIMSGQKEADRRATARRFARILARHRVLGRVPAILVAYEKLSLRAKGERKVRIESAAPVSEEIKKEIAGILGAEIHFEEKETP